MKQPFELMITPATALRTAGGSVHKRQDRAEALSCCWELLTRSAEHLIGRFCSPVGDMRLQLKKFDSKRKTCVCVFWEHLSRIALGGLRRNIRRQAQQVVPKETPAQRLGFLFAQECKRLQFLIYSSTIYRIRR